MSNKQAYFQGGGGENEPTPGKKKYKSDPAIVVQPRFEEPFYHNYDVYDVPGEYGPGAGYHDLMEHKSVKDFLEFRRKRLKNKYKADDSWKMDDGKISKNIKNAQLVRIADLLKQAGPNYDLGQGVYDNMDKYHNIKQFRQKPHGSVIMDHNNLDFPSDGLGSSPIIGDSGSSYMDSVPISYMEDYTSLPDAEDKGEYNLDFGQDLEEEVGPGRGDPEEINLEDWEEKYLPSSETGLFGMPDGVDPEGHDADQTIGIINPYSGITDVGRQMYKDYM